MKKIIFTVVFLSIVLIFSLVFYHREKVAMQSVNDFNSCLENGYPVMESYPRQCVTPDSRSFVEVIKEVEVVDTQEEKIVVTTPKAGDVVSSPIKIEGEARGNWFFEGSFPAKLVDEDGKEIAIIPVTAKTDWMTEDFVEFYAELSFDKVSTKSGTLILQKDNPSGLPEYDDSISIPVKF